MTLDTLWIPTVGEWIIVPHFSNQKPVVMAVSHRFRNRKNGQRFIQCGEYLFPLEVCSVPQWLPQPGDRVRAKDCGYEGTVHGLYVHEQGHVMADCRMYRQPDGKPVHPDFRIWPSPVDFLEPVEGVKHG